MLYIIDGKYYNTPVKGDVAQRLEQATHNRLVVGSSPTVPIHALVAQRLEQPTHNRLVQGSNPCECIRRVVRLWCRRCVVALRARMYD